jgi:hypothetical protein
MIAQAVDPTRFCVDGDRVYVFGRGAIRQGAALITTW